MTTFNQSVDSKHPKSALHTQETYKEYLLSGETLTHKRIPPKILGLVSEPLNDEYEGALSVGHPQMDKIPLNPINNIDLTAIENEELKRQIEWLEERHVKDTAELDEMRAKCQSEKIRGNKFCDDMIRARRQYTESEAKVANLIEQIKRQDELLVAADRDSKLLFAVMAKAVELDKRIQVAVEGGDF